MWLVSVCLSESDRCVCLSVWIWPVCLSVCMQPKCRLFYVDVIFMHLTEHIYTRVQSCECTIGGPQLEYNDELRSITCILPTCFNKITYYAFVLFSVWIPIVINWSNCAATWSSSEVLVWIARMIFRCLVITFCPRKFGFLPDQQAVLNPST